MAISDELFYAAHGFNMSPEKLVNDYVRSILDSILADIDECVHGGEGSKQFAMGVDIAKEQCKKIIEEYRGKHEVSVNQCFKLEKQQELHV